MTDKPNGATAGTAKTLEFFYDFSSPYAYLAHTEAAAVAQRHDATLVYRPFFLGGLFKQLGSSMIPINDATAQKRTWLAKDIARWAELRDLPYAWPSTFPMNTIPALRVALQLLGPEHAEAHARVCSALFTGYWGRGLDISQPDVLRRLLDDADLDGSALLDGTRDPAVKARLFEATTEILERGGIGAPTFFVGDLCFWGQDRFAMIERALEGWIPTAG